MNCKALFVFFMLLMVQSALVPPGLLSAGEDRQTAGDWYWEEQIIPFQASTTRPGPGPFDTLFLFLSGEEEGFNLPGLYDELEPPEQDGFLGRYSILAEDSVYFLVPAFLAMVTIYLLPEDVSNWTKDDINLEDSWDNWKENVVSWHWDKDDYWINYIGHPYFGSTYFIYARHYGYSRLESLLFSFSISAFYEFGIEAWAEPVSIQDLIFTPLLGWVVAEILLPLEHRIRKNGDKVLSSRILGAISLFLIDPFGHVVPAMKGWAQYIFSRDTDVMLAPVMVQQLRHDQGAEPERFYGMRMTVTW